MPTIGRRTSLQSRQLLAASLGLVAFLGLTGYALDRAFVNTAVDGVRDRLQTYLHGYVARTDIDRSSRLILPEVPPEPRFDQPGGSLFAGVHGEKFSWQSTSALGRGLPFEERLPRGEVRFEGPLDTPAGSIYRLGMGLDWEISDTESVLFTFFVAESASILDRQVRVFRRALWGYLGGAGLALLALQILVSRWALQPLRRVVRDLASVERGVAERLSGDYPRELALLTDNLNAFIESEREHLTRYRNTLGDLAHSLKTPLAVLRSRLDSGVNDEDALRSEVKAQVSRMDEIVAYQLKRAATSGHQRFSAPLEIEPKAEELVRSLEKVYASKGVLCEFDLDAQARFHGELGDLMELLGNLLENAFKWANRRVMLTVRVMPGPATHRAGIMVAVDDDGPGIPADQVERLLQRGVRGDERVHGHGIGLAIVQDIVRAYRGELHVLRSEELGGARFEIRIPPLR